MNILLLIGKIFSYIYTPKIKCVLSGIKVFLRSGYYSRFFKHVGRHVVLCESSSFGGTEFISFGNNVCIGRRTEIKAWKTGTANPSIVIADNVNIGDDCHITASNSIEIKESVLLGKKVTITDNSHGSFTESDLSKIPYHRDVISKGAVIIGERVWIGDKVTVLPGVTIGEAAIIGANSVVTHDIPAYSVAAGVPAKVLKTLH